MRLSRCYREQRKLLKTGENQRVQTGQVGLANRPIKPLWHLSAACFQQLSTVRKICLVCLWCTITAKVGAPRELWLRKSCEINPGSHWPSHQRLGKPPPLAQMHRS